MNASSNENGNIACASAGGSLGLAALAGVCSSGCGLAAAPIASLFASFLASFGLGSVTTIVPTIRIPLILLAAALGAFAIWSLVRKKQWLEASVYGVVLGIGGTFLGWQTIQANDCRSTSQVEGVLKKLSPHAKEVFQKGVYPLWPELGRAPTIAEVRDRLGIESDSLVMSAFQELEKMGFNGIFFSGTQQIKWFWPFSSLDHGVEVVLMDADTLAKTKPVHARCAIDALGMSAMFGKVAHVFIKSPLDKSGIEMAIDGDKIIKSSPGIVVSYSDSCDEMLFFASQDEYLRYVKETGKQYLKIYTLQEALERGVRSFGGVLKV